MPNYFRYLLRQVAGPSLVIGASFTAIIWLTQSLRFIDLIINKGLSVGVFLYLTVLLLPSLLTVILPVAVLAGVLYAYHRLAVDSELVVLRAAGLGNLQIAAPALALAAVITVIGYANTLFLMPTGFRAFKDLQFEIRHSYASVLIQEGVFNTPIDGLTVYVRERGSSGELRGILVHDERDPSRPATMMAERGALVNTEEGPRFVLFNGNRQEIDKQAGNLSMLYFDRYSFDFSSPGTAGGTRTREAKERYPSELLFPEEGLQERQNRELLAEFHQRIVGPLNAIVFTAIACAALLFGETNRRGHSARILVAIGIAVLVQAVGLALVSLMVRVPAAAILLYLLIAAVIAGGFYVLTSERKTLLPRPAPPLTEAG